MGLPRRDLVKLIIFYVSTYKLLDSVYEEKTKLVWLSINQSTIELLKENPDKINWDNLSKNPAIFK